MFVFRQILYTLVLLCALAVQAGATSPTLSALAAQSRLYPDSITARHALEDAVDAGLPDTLPATLLPDLPLDAAAAADGLGTLIVPKTYLTSQAEEPQHGQAFPKITYFYGPGDSIFCRVHYMTPDDAPLAARISSLLALAHRTLGAKMGNTPRTETPFDVWLCRAGKAGGEQWGGNLYFYDLDAPRSSIEWVREIVHEYSHLALPPIGGYKNPEYWASGYLGERLLVRWLQRTPGGPALVSRVWGDFSGAQNFDRLLIDPAIALYKHIGPNPKWLARIDAEGMRYLIGQTLTMDDKYGSHAVAAAFACLPRTARAADLADAFAQVASRQAANRHP